MFHLRPEIENLASIFFVALIDKSENTNRKKNKKTNPQKKNHMERRSDVYVDSLESTTHDLYGETHTHSSGTQIRRPKKQKKKSLSAILTLRKLYQRSPLKWMKKPLWELLRESREPIGALIWLILWDKSAVQRQQQHPTTDLRQFHRVFCLCLPASIFEFCFVACPTQCVSIWGVPLGTPPEMDFAFFYSLLLLRSLGWVWVKVWVRSSSLKMLGSNVFCWSLQYFLLYRYLYIYDWGKFEQTRRFVLAYGIP